MLSRHASVKDVEDNEMTSVGPTLDVDGKGGGPQGNGTKATSVPSDW